MCKGKGTISPRTNLERSCQEESELFGNDPDFAEFSDVLKRLERERANHNPSSSVVIPSCSEVVSEDVLYWVGCALNDVCSVGHGDSLEGGRENSLPSEYIITR